MRRSGKSVSLFTMSGLFMQVLHLMQVITLRVMTADLSRLSRLCGKMCYNFRKRHNSKIMPFSWPLRKSW